MSTEARSSTFSHFSSNFGKATVGSAEAQFAGITLDNDIRDAPTWQVVSLVVLASVLLLKPKFERRETTVAFWLGAITISGVLLAEVTWIPLLTTIVYTRTTYPKLVVIPHCIASNAAYRAVHGDKADRFRALLFAFFLYGFGGSIVSDVLVGVPATALAHPTIVPFHVLGWALVWYSPADWVYSSYSRSDSFFHYFIEAAESVDAVTTPMGRIGRAGRELRDKVAAPLMAGLFAGIGGGLIRLFSNEPGTTYATVQSGFYKTMGYSLLFWSLNVYRCHEMLDPESEGYSVNHCVSYNGSDLLRVVIVSAHVLWTLLCETGLASGHPFVWACQNLFHGNFATTFTSVFRLGPQMKETDGGRHKKLD